MRILNLHRVLNIIAKTIIRPVTYLISRSRYLYAIGNQRWNNRLVAFGFVKPLPEGFLHPADLLLRWFPGKGISFPVAEQKEWVARSGDFLDIEYMPDYTNITLTRWPYRGNHNENVDENVHGDIWVKRDHPIGILPMPSGSANAIEEPTYFSKTFAGKTYKCIEVQLVIQGKPPTSEADRFRALKAERMIHNPDQYFKVEVYTPGNQINFDCVNKLLDCLDLE